MGKTGSTNNVPIIRAMENLFVNFSFPSFPVTGSSTYTRTLNFFVVTYIRECSRKHRANRNGINVLN